MPKFQDLTNDGPSVITSPVPRNIPQNILKRKLEHDNDASDDNNNDNPVAPKRAHTMAADIQEMKV